MSWGQWGPLVGVVVGAILGGLAQILNDVLRSRRDIRMQRIEATRAFIDAFRTSVMAHQRAPHRRAGTEIPAPADYSDEDWRIIETDERLEAARAYLLLLDASRKTRALASGLVWTVREDEVDWAGSDWNAKVGTELESLIKHARRG